MKKRITSIFLMCIMVIGMLISVIPTYAATPFVITITSDKAEVYPGDVITYTVTMGAVENFQSANFTLLIPEGVTFVEGKISEELKEKTGATEAGFENSTLTFFCGGLGSYSSEEETILMTFTCVMGEELREYDEVTILNDYDFADSKWNSYEDIIIDASASKVTVVEKKIPATSITLSKSELVMKEGTSEKLVAKVSPENTSDILSWVSDDEVVATVDNDGNVTAGTKGTTVITVTAGSMSTTCKITVTCAHTNTTTHPAVDSTCTIKGNRAYATCDDCNVVVDGSDEKLSLDKENHVNTEVHKKEIGDCVNPGHEDYVYCNDCKTVVDGSAAPVVGPHGAFVENTKEIYLKSPADCVNAAIYYKSCALCGYAHKSEVFVYGEALGHEYSEKWSNGEEGHWYECNVCNDKDSLSIHDFGDAGDVCLICAYEREHVHKLTLVEAVEATCNDGGNRAYYSCAGCEEWFEDATGAVIIADKTSVIVKALGHDMMEATCTNAQNCKRCDKTEGDALGHSFTKYISNNDATYIADGTKTATCNRCDEKHTITDIGSKKAYDADNTITESADGGVILTGIFEDGAQVIVLELDRESEVYQIIKNRVKEGYKIVYIADIMVKREIVSDQVTVTIPLGTDYNTRNLIVYHMLNNGDVEEYTDIVQDGMVSVTVDSLSPFAVAIKEAEDNMEDIPQTADTNQIVLWISLFAMSFLVIILVLRREVMRDFKS